MFKTRQEMRNHVEKYGKPYKSIDGIVDTKECTIVVYPDELATIEALADFTSDNGEKVRACYDDGFNLMYTTRFSKNGKKSNKITIRIGKVA